MVGLGGLEPPTSPLSGVRSNQLIYRPVFFTLLIRTVTFAVAKVPAYLPARICCVVRIIPIENKLCGHSKIGAYHIKEVIQPQVPLRLPCYDFTPVMNHTVVNVPLAVRLSTSGAAHSHGVTGGVYKARERIHRGVLIHDY